MVVGDFAVELDTVVVGAGPDGHVAAIHVAEMKQKVVIIEREYVDGVRLNIGCIPSKALIAAGHHYQESLDSEMFGVISEDVKLDFAKTQEWKESKVVHTLTSGVGFPLKKRKVETIEEEAFFVGDHTLRVIHPDSAQTYSFDNAIIATGSHPIEIPGFKFRGRVLGSTGGLTSREVPKRFVIIGGGVIGAELGGAYASLGVKVTILEDPPQILPTYEEDLVKLVEDDFKKKGVTVVMNTMVKEAVDNSDSATVKYTVDGKEESVTADYVMVTVGHRPNTNNMGLEQVGVEIGERELVTVDRQGRTNVPNIYIIDDIVPEAALTHKASYETKIAAEAISGKKVTIDYKAVPAVAFTGPELVSVGMAIREVKDADIEARTYKFSFSGNGRVLSLSKTEESIRLVTTVEDNVLIGAQIGRVGVSDMVSELALTVEPGMNAEDTALTIHPHPSLSKVVMDVSELALDLPIHT